MEIKMQQFGVRLEPRGSKDPHIAVQLLTEDDENWFEHGNSFSSAWIDDIILALQTAKSWMDANGKPDLYDMSVSPPRRTDDPMAHQVGFKFKK